MTRLLAVCLTAVLAAGAYVPAGAATDIRPGDRVIIGAATCTLGFVFDGSGSQAGKVYLSTAAGCVGSLGADAGLDTGEVFGDVAYIGDPAVAATDFALVQVRPEYHSRVSAAVRGGLAPTGVARLDETQTGDRVRVTGQGPAFGLTGTSSRDGVLVEDGAGTHRTLTAIGPGDAGAPVVHVATGKALGTVSAPGYCPSEPCPLPAGPAACRLDECPPTWLGPSVEGLLARAAAAGLTITLR